MKAVLRALSAALVCAAPSVAQAQVPGSTSPWQGPGMPAVNGPLGPFGQPLPGHPDRTVILRGWPSPNNPVRIRQWDPVGVDPFNPAIPAIPAIPGFPAIPGAPGIPDVPGVPRNLWEFHNRLQNGPPGNPGRPNVPPGNLGQVPQISPEVLKNLLIPRDEVIIPKFDLNLPSSRPPAPAKAPKVPSWVRWEWAVGIFVVSLVGGLVSGYLRRGRSRAWSGQRGR